MGGLFERTSLQTKDLKNSSNLSISLTIHLANSAKLTLPLRSTSTKVNAASSLSLLSTNLKGSSHACEQNGTEFEKVHVFFVHFLADVRKFFLGQTLVAVAIHDAKQQQSTQHFGKVVTGTEGERQRLTQQNTPNKRAGSHSISGYVSRDRGDSTLSSNIRMVILAMSGLG